MSPGDPWSGAGKSTRDEVREIFARHAEARPAAPAEEERRHAQAGFLALPLRGWRALPGAGKAVVVLVALALLALAAVKLPPAFENAAENEANERQAIAENRERIRRRLVEDQRPRRAILTARAGFGAALAEEVTADARRRVRAGTLEGPIRSTGCERIPRRGEDPDFAVYTCLVERGERGRYRDRDLLIGYRFRGRVERSSGSAVWCKENPQPLHPDTEEFVKVPLSRECTG
jgi:hypothetical protein